MIKEVDEENIRTSIEKVKIPNKRNVQEKHEKYEEDVEFGLKPSFFVELKDLEPSTAEPSIKISRAEQHFTMRKSKESKESTSRYIKSSRVGNANMMLMSLSDSS